jgi:predicted small lipoprotein YifL
MRSMQGRMFAAAALVALAACGKEKQPEATPAAAPAPAVTSPVVSSPASATTIARAAKPGVPKKGVTMATSIGTGPLAENTAQAGDAGDSSWVEQIDVDGDSTAEQATFLWDDETKILYIGGQDDEVCVNGGTANLATLTALFAAGNVRGAPVGSGWSADYVDATQCGAASPVLWGERFDSTGTVTKAGVATIDPATGDLVITTATDSTMTTTTVAPAPAPAPAN